MIIDEVSFDEYQSVFGQPFQVYNSVAFSELNRNKVHQIHYCIFRDTKARLGIVMGEKDNRLLSPFSAPFGGFSFNKPQMLETIEQAVLLLREYALKNNFSIAVSLPPNFYSPSMISKFIFSFHKNGFIMDHIDLNYHFLSSDFSNYDLIIDRSEKKHMDSDSFKQLSFLHLDSRIINDLSCVYDVIKINRETKGFPLRMSFENVADTVKVIRADIFMVKYLGYNVASALVFHVANQIVQVIYWGDDPEYSNLHPMNYLTYNLFKYYQDTDIKILDIGPSTDCGEPNYGLCRFKENIGCKIALKYTFRI